MRILRNYTVALLPSYKCCPLKGDRLLVTTWAIVPLVKHPSVTATPMNLSAAQGTGDRSRIRQECRARGECLCCSTIGHFIHKCPVCAAHRNQRLALAATAGATDTAEPEGAAQVLSEN